MRTFIGSDVFQKKKSSVFQNCIADYSDVSAIYCKSFIIHLQKNSNVISILQTKNNVITLKKKKIKRSSKIWSFFFISKVMNLKKSNNAMIFLTIWIVYVSFALCIFCHSNMADMHIKNKKIFYFSGISFFNRKVFEGKKSSLLVLSFFPKVDTEILLWNALNIWAQWLAHSLKKFHSCEHGSKYKKINKTLTPSCVSFLIFFFPLLNWK